MFENISKSVRAGVAAVGIMAAASGLEAQTITLNGLPTAVHSSIKDPEYRNKFDSWVLTLPNHPKLKATVDKIANAPFDKTTENRPYARVDFKAIELPNLLKGDEVMSMNINRYDAALDNSPDQIVFVIEKYPSATSREYFFKANAVYNIKTKKFETRVDK